MKRKELRKEAKDLLVLICKTVDGVKEATPALDWLDVAMVLSDAHSFAVNLRLEELTRE